MQNIGRTFELDPSRYPWEGTEEYPDDYPFGIPEEEQRARYAESSERHKQLQVELQEFYEVDFSSTENLLPRAQTLAKEYALFACKFGLASHGDSINVATWSDDSVIETERWWHALQQLNMGDWSYLIGELYEEGKTSIRAGRDFNYGIDNDQSESDDPVREFGKALTEAIVNYIPGAFEMADRWYEEGVALQNIARILHMNLSY